MEWYFFLKLTDDQVLRMRSSAGTSSSVITSIPADGQVRDLGGGLQSANGYNWRNIDYNGVILLPVSLLFIVK